jgi:hypothetical protein
VRQGEALVQQAEGGGMTIVTSQALEAAAAGGRAALLEVAEVAQARALLGGAVGGALMVFVCAPDELEASLAQVRPCLPYRVCGFACCSRRSRMLSPQGDWR